MNYFIKHMAQKMYNATRCTEGSMHIVLVVTNTPASPLLSTFNILYNHYSIKCKLLHYGNIDLQAYYSTATQTVLYHSVILVIWDN